MKKILHHPKWQKTGFLLYCLVPFVVIYAVFMLYPSVKIFVNAGFRWSGLSLNKEFVGFDNFVRLFKDDHFWDAFGNTAYFLLVSSAVTLVISLFLAYALTRTKLRERNVYRVLFFFPNVLSIVVIGTLFRNIYAPDTGILNSFLSTVGLGNWTHAWLGESKTVLGAVTAAMVWQAFGYYMVMYIAGMDSISPELYEAAELDGASRRQQFFTITLPMMWEIVRITLIFFITATMNLSFLFVSVMTNGGPNGKSDVLLTYMYRQAFTSSNFGSAMAVAAVIFVFSLALALVLNLLTKRDD